MGVKRELFPSSRSMAKRLKRVERMAANNRSEMKSVTFDVTGTIGTGVLSNHTPSFIASGTNINQRIGDRIRIWRVEFRGQGASDLDWYILQGHGTDAPVIGDFSGATVSPYILDSARTSTFSEWKHYRNYSLAASSALSPIKFSQKFQYGIIAHYDGPSAGDGVRNRLFITVVNRTGGSRSFDGTIRLWYTDS